MANDETLSYDPWQQLAKSGQVKKVDLDQALQRLKVSESEAPVVKREMLDQVRKLIKPTGQKK